jgi:acetyltransferase-like isoleucine patch superfamily enzyme
MGVARRFRNLAQEPMARAALRGRLQAPYRRARFHSFGAGSLIDRPQWLYGTHQISIGRGVVILGGAWLAAERVSWEAAEPAMTIGDGTMFRANCVVSASSGVTIEENVLLAGSCTIVDSDHTVGSGEWNPLFNETVASPIRVGAGSWLAERVTVLRGSDIGRNCIIGAHSVVRGEIPDNSIAAGSPARVVGTTPVSPSG